LRLAAEAAQRATSPSRLRPAETSVPKGSSRFSRKKSSSSPASRAHGFGLEHREFELHFVFCAKAGIRRAASGADIGGFHHASEGNAVVVRNLRAFRGGVDVDV